MTCFVRGIHSCKIHKDMPLAALAPEAPEQPESPADRVRVYETHEDPLPGWDCVRSRAGLGWGPYCYVRSDGCMIYWVESLDGSWWWRFDHTVFGRFVDHAAIEARKLMFWADLKVPLVPHEDPDALRARRRASAIRELGRSRS